MNAATLKALKGSIRKWQRIVNGTGEDRGMHNCPLCKMYLGALRDDKTCAGCPVAEKTGLYGCYGTPYYDYAFRPTQENARCELEFLKSLLPEPRKEAKP